MDIDAEIEAAIGLPAENAQPEADAVEPPAPEESAPAEPQEPVDTPQEDAFPKKAVNAISRRDKMIGKLRAELAAERAEIEKLRTQTSPKAQPLEPKESDFDNYGDFLEAKTAASIEKKFLEQQSKLQETQSSQQQQAQYQAWEQKRLAEIDKQAIELSKNAPEIDDLFDEHEETIREYSPELKQLFLNADNAALAFYNLAKEGKLEAIAEMPLARAAMEIGRAQSQALPTKPKSNAPAPMRAARGSAPGSKPLHEMSDDELMKWVKS